MRNINGLVTRCSSVKRNRKPIGERASSKLRCLVTASSYVATKPKARSPMGFLLCGSTRTPHDSKTSTRGRGRKEYMVCRKARGQFPNNPCDWSNHQVEGHTQKRSMMILFTGVKYLILSTPSLWGRGVFG